jgi:hypothetical protein
MLRKKVVQILRSTMYIYYSLYFKFFRLPKLIFIISTMRSYTSVLSHIIGSHHKVLGKGEKHLQYDTLQHEEHIYECLFQNRSFFPRYDYILDNVNWDGEEPKGKFFEENKQNLQIIFLLRKTNDTLASIIKRGGLNWFDISNYYLLRLNTIKSNCKKLISNQIPYLYINAEDLILHQEFHLKRISNFLNFQKNLSPKYKIDSMTGHHGYSDNSKNIFTKKLLKQPITYDDIDQDISEHLHLYSEVTQILKNNSE